MIMRKQRGFTVIELVVAMGLAGLLTPLIASSIFQVTRGTDQVNTKTLALADIDNASNWMNRDLPLAQQVLDSATLNPLVGCAVGNRSSVRVTWVDGTIWAVGNPQHFAEYYIEPGTTLLKRNYDGNVMVVGRHIATISFCKDTDGLVHIDLASSVKGITDTTKTLFFYINPRSEVAIQ